MAKPSSLAAQAQDNSAAAQTLPLPGTALAAFVGRTLRGPANRPVMLRSFGDFQAIFGGLWQPSPLTYAVEQFFELGGREALVVRVVNGARAVGLTLAAGGGSLRLRARAPGTREFLRASVDYDGVPAGNTERFNLIVQRVRAQGAQYAGDHEVFRNVTVRLGGKGYLRDALADSQLVELVGAVPLERPASTVESLNGAPGGFVNSSLDGDDGAPLTDYDLIGSASERTGLFALSAREHFNFLCIPPPQRDRDVGPSALLVALRLCRQRHAMLIVDPPLGWKTVEDALRGLRDWQLASEDALMYFPRILALDKLRGRFEAFAPCGAVAGLLARHDEQQPPWTPAVAEQAVLPPGFRPTCVVPEERRMRLAAYGVNVLQATRSPLRSPVPARTLVGAGGTADRVSLAARRLELFIINAIVHGTRWAQSAPPTEEVAARVKTQVCAFLETLRLAGAFANRRAADAYFVICDRRLNGAEEIRLSKFQLLVGFFIGRGGESHAVRITHGESGCEVTAAMADRHRHAQADFAPPAAPLRTARRPAGRRAPGA